MGKRTGHALSAVGALTLWGVAAAGGGGGQAGGVGPSCGLWGLAGLHSNNTELITMQAERSCNTRLSVSLSACTAAQHSLHDATPRQSHASNCVALPTWQQAGL